MPSPSPVRSLCLLSAQGDLPTFSQRGEIPVFLNGMFALHNNVVLVPAYAPFQRGQPFVYGALWTVDFNGQRPQQTLSPLNYYLAGASGVPVRA